MDRRLRISDLERRAVEARSFAEAQALIAEADRVRRMHGDSEGRYRLPFFRN